jgi:MtN3 and saliva related transmembrane protein
MGTVATAIGLAAAICTTAANLPQLKKAWVTGQTNDLSLKTLLLFASGLALWIIYGFLQTDFVIILANGISLLILSVLLYLKLTQRPTTPPTSCSGSKESVELKFQRRDVRYWHKADAAADASDVRF